MEQKALVFAQEINDAFNVLTITSNLAAFHQLMGDWMQAAAGYASAVELAQKLGNGSELARTEQNRGVLALYQGDLSTARRSLEFSLQDARQRGNIQTIVTSLLYLCKTHLAEGTPAALLPRLIEAEKLAEESQMAYQLPMIHELHAHCLLAEGKSAEAEERIQRSLAEARRQKMSSEEGIALRVLGEIRLLAGENGEAGLLFAQSLACLTEDPYEAAQTQRAWGKLLVAKGDVSQGQERLSAAREIFERLGAPLMDSAA